MSNPRLLPPRYRIVLAANVLFCLAGVFTALPSWRMFESIPDPRYALTDASGASVRVEDWLPRDAYALSPRTLVSVARFACERDDVRPPLFLSTDGRSFAIERYGDRCLSRELGDAGR